MILLTVYWWRIMFTIRDTMTGQGMIGCRVKSERLAPIASMRYRTIHSYKNGPGFSAGQMLGYVTLFLGQGLAQHQLTVTINVVPYRAGSERRATVSSSLTVSCTERTIQWLVVR